MLHRKIKMVLDRFVDIMKRVTDAMCEEARLEDLEIAYRNELRNIDAKLDGKISLSHYSGVDNSNIEELNEYMVSEHINYAGEIAKCITKKGVADIETVGKLQDDTKMVLDYDPVILAVAAPDFADAVPVPEFGLIARSVMGVGIFGTILLLRRSSLRYDFAKLVQFFRSFNKNNKFSG